MANNVFRRSLRSRLTASERRTVLFLGDLTATGMALLIALITWARGDDWFGFSPEFFAERPENWFYLLPILWLLLMVPLYDVKRAASIRFSMTAVSLVTAIGFLTYLIIFFVAPPKALPRRGVAVFILTCSLLTVVWRILYIRFLTGANLKARTLIVGAGKAGSRIAQIIRDAKDSPYDLVGFIDDDPEKIGKTIEGIPVLGDSYSFYKMIATYNVSHVIMAISNRMNKDLFESLTIAEETGLTVVTMPRVYEDLLKRVPVYLLGTDWMVRDFYDQAHSSVLQDVVKRVFDLTGAGIGMILTGIFFPFIALAILIDSGRPVFYTQERLGLHGEPFKILKFRTMFTDAEADGVARPASESDSRITRTGNFLRRSHLDELPQFINVLRGDVSLVGPRAERKEIVEQLQKTIPFYRGRLLVRPGITGWAQINYGYASGAEQNAVKLEYDLYYIKRRSLPLDISILFKTVKSVFGLKGR